MAFVEDKFIIKANMLQAESSLHTNIQKRLALEGVEPRRPQKPP